MFLVRVCDIAEGYKDEYGWNQVVDLDEYHLAPYKSIIRNGCKEVAELKSTTFAVLYLKPVLKSCESMEELKVKLNMMGIGHASY